MARSQSKPQAKTGGFLPASYEPPTSSNNYMKLKKGENKIRFIDPPIFGYVQWEDKKPLRTRHEEGMPEAINSEEPPKHFWAMRIYDYADSEVKILELTQLSVQKAIKGLNEDGDWGTPLDYDLKITRSGDSLQTKYAVTPIPKKPLTKEILKAVQAKPCNLEALYDGEDPWAE